MKANERTELLERYVVAAMLSANDAKLLADWAASGETCAKVVDAALNAAGWGTDANKRRRALAVVLARVRNTKACM